MGTRLHGLLHRAGEVELWHTSHASVRGLTEHGHDEALAPRHKSRHRGPGLSEQKARHMRAVQGHQPGTGGIRHQRGQAREIRSRETRMREVDGAVEHGDPDRGSAQKPGFPGDRAQYRPDVHPLLRSRTLWSFRLPDWFPTKMFRRYSEKYGTFIDEALKMRSWSVLNAFSVCREIIFGVPERRFQKRPSGRACLVRRGHSGCSRKTRRAQC